MLDVSIIFPSPVCALFTYLHYQPSYNIIFVQKTFFPTANLPIIDWFIWLFVYEECNKEILVAIFKPIISSENKA